MFTTQNMFDTVVNHLRTGNTFQGGFSSINDRGPCFCAKGILMRENNTKFVYISDRFGDVNAVNDVFPSISATMGRQVEEFEKELLHDLEFFHEGIAYASGIFVDVTNKRSEVYIRNKSLCGSSKEDQYKALAERYNLVYSLINTLPETEQPIVPVVNKVETNKFKEVA